VRVCACASMRCNIRVGVYAWLRAWLRVWECVRAWLRARARVHTVRAYVCLAVWRAAMV
jgi:hypothetical protein